ncbi:ABC transporter permease [Bacillus thuringiensis]|jgi:peptide/nickel transport system permease protein|uniref:ABC transporter permease n=3 Tax=Bacillus cereus group TaxID=86661 RepID=A0A9X7FY45_BACTU|nr:MULTISPECIES: oligopeptide ABC transporter permease [Bacillus]KIQ89885.1 peptide ABC transporter permease [Bacillus sp. L_1B0_8]KIQ91865.1 peptide ABC transporter permease [Bacillus sp. L_1B0_5]KMQ05389.1 peptide ABC transporter permease [Bacillus cereus]MCQ6335390.1 ABC transporter permease [Bacillus cereus]MCU7662024.1 ABC transporter permease [Bacillus thuringiensis]
MWKFILRRVLVMIPQLFILSVLVFTLAKAMPGDALSGAELANPKADPKVLEEQREKLGLNDPIPTQYVRWISNAVQGDFGISYAHKIKVTDIIGERLGNTILLALLILILTYLIAIPLGVISGRWNDTWADRIITLYNFLGFGTPLFIFGLVMLFLFGFLYPIFPTSGSVDPQVVTGSFDYYLSKFNHMILPALSGALIGTVGTVQYLRSEIIDTKHKDFVRTVKAKGVPESKVYSRHILRNSFLPIAAFLGYEITGLVGGSIILENIFGYPGIGQLFFQSITQRDFSVVTALVLFTGFATLLGTLLSDIILSIVDPRIRID